VPAPVGVTCSDDANGAAENVAMPAQSVDVAVNVPPYALSVTATLCAAPGPVVAKSRRAGATAGAGAGVAVGVAVGAAVGTGLAVGAAVGADVGFTTGDVPPPPPQPHKKYATEHTAARDSITLRARTAA